MSNKLALLEGQIGTIEETIEQMGYASVLKQSNQVIERMNAEMDLEEVRLAKQLQEEGKMRREELEELLKDEEEDESIKGQLDEIERMMVEKALSGLTGFKEKAGGEEGRKGEQKEKQQSVLLNN
jgi:hypothetical protein